MANFAVIKDNIVVNVILADTLEDAEQATNSTCIEYTEEAPAGIGWYHNGETFENPNPPVAESPAETLSAE
jgi:hypothetical protein